MFNPNRVLYIDGVEQPPGWEVSYVYQEHGNPLSELKEHGDLHLFDGRGDWIKSYHNIKLDPPMKTLNDGSVQTVIRAYTQGEDD